jgi:hypothetical protein
MTTQPHDDDVDDEGVWELICEAAAKHSGIPVKRARAILEDAGYSASQHHGVGDAFEFAWQVMFGGA